MGKRCRFLAVAVSAVAGLAVGGILIWLSSPPVAASEMVGPGSLNVIAKPGEKLRDCPLEHTDVEGWIVGEVAHVRVTQRFANPYREPIEAVYVFPLPENSAVNDMVMRIGKRTIRGVIKTREQARETYEHAKRAGKTASLLEQERPNIFTQSVANIMPGDAIEITIWCLQDLRYDSGRYEFTFPMVVGPRYLPGGALPGPQTGGGWSPDTERVPDASRITPPVLKPDERTGHDISLKLHLDAGVPAYDVASKSHDVVVDSYRGQPLIVSLADHETLPNKDFSLSWRVAGERAEVGLLTNHDERSGYFTLILQPKATFDAAEITAKEMVFCLDTSGSMSGLPLQKSKEVVKQCLQQMGPHDTFQVVRFAADCSTFRPEPVPATPANVQEALDFVDRMEGSGGTEMLGGIEASLALPEDRRRMRIVAFLTDGYIGNESEILARIESKLGNARIFSFGIGSSVNRYLLVKMPQLGRGFAQFVRQDEDPDEAVRTFVGRIARPYLTDIDIDWGGLDVVDVYPPYVPDLFADQPVILHGRYETPGAGVITIRGTVAGQPWETRVQVSLPADQPENEAVAILWARAAIEDMLDQMHSGENEKLKSAITDLALAYRLMSPYTSFVAVEEKVVNRGGQQVTVQVPVPMPEGVRYEGVFGPAMQESGALAGLGGPSAYPATTAAGSGGGIAIGRGFGGARAGLGSGHMRSPFIAGIGAGGPAGPSALPVDEAESLLYGGAPLQDAWMAFVCTDDHAKQAARAIVNLRRKASTAIGLPVGGVSAIDPTRPESLGDAHQLQVLLILGSKPLELDQKGRAALASYLRRGGFVIVDSGGDAFYRSVTRLLRDILPGARFARVPASHAIYRGRSMPFTLPSGCPAATSFETTGPAQGLFLGDRLAVFISRGNLASAWSQPDSAQRAGAYEAGVNLIAYALQTAASPRR